MLARIKDEFYWIASNDHVRRVFHTAWQVGIPTLIAHLALARSSADVKASFVFAGSASLAAVKALVLNWLENRG